MEIKTYLKSLSFLHLSLVAGVALFTIFAVSKVQRFDTANGQGNVLLYAVPVVALIGYFGSQFIFKKLLSSLKNTDSLEDKLKKFQSASLVKYAFIEAPTFLALFIYYSSGNALPLVIALCLLAYLYVQKPNKERIIKSLPLTSEEVRTLQQ
ncbi:hypothetical protein [Maribacter sp. 2210JD10-5]|uniref:hypothetical protein n=1 Tax=Maribacter sp. 2210JD10-5 TaxID=3386272 RepID=UPI0039BD45DD